MIHWVKAKATTFGLEIKPTFFHTQDNEPLEQVF